MLDIRRARHTIDQRRDVGRTTDRVEVTRLVERFLQRDEIDRLAALRQRDHLVEDAAMRVAVKIVRVDRLNGGIEGVVVQQDGPEHRAFGFKVVRQRAFGNSGVGHGEEEVRNSELRNQDWTGGGGTGGSIQRGRR